MQEILFDMAVLGLFVFLFAAMSMARGDNRLWFWVGGWLSVVAHFGAEVWQPLGQPWQHVQACISVDALALGGTCFILSTAAQHARGTLIRHLGLMLTVLTLLGINLAIIGAPVLWPLVTVVVARQSLAIGLTRVARRKRPRLGAIIVAVCLVTGAWMLTAIFTGHPGVVPNAILWEIFLVAAADFWTNGWERTAALYTVVAGLVGWAFVFPISWTLLAIWPQLDIDREDWNLPKFAVAIGMILVILEEDTRAARALGEDYRLLFDRNPQALWITDLATLSFLDVNQPALRLHGYTREEFLNLKLTDILHHDLREVVLVDVRSGASEVNRQVRHLRKDGTVLPLDLTAHDIVFHGRRCHFVTAVDISDRENLKQLLDRQSTQDQLTGLPNRRTFPDLLAREVQRAVDNHEKLAVLSLDVDRFKRINDVYGLRVGDECIQRIASALTSSVRSMDIVSRTTSEGFAIVLTGIKSTANVEQVAHSLLELLSEPLIVQGYKLQLSFSMGLAVCPSDGTDPMALWRSAESARSQAKAAGGNQLVWISPELDRLAEEAIELEAYMRGHMDDGGFQLLYQPLYGMDGTVQELEALLRLNHPKFGPVSPVRVIPVAEDSGLIVPLGQWVIEAVFRQLLVWKSQGVRLVPVAINVSGLQLMHVDFAARLLKTMERYAIESSLVHIEITESVAMHNADEVTEQVATLAKQGIAFSIDDFGTGHSSLARLSQLGVSALKIDRSFMRPGCTEEAHTIVQAIITMAHALGRKVVAEGVESESQVACLRQLHCDLLQGFLLSRPAPPEQIPALISAVHPALADDTNPPHADNLHLVARAGD